MKFTLPATPAQCPVKQRRFGWRAGLLTQVGEKSKAVWQALAVL
jgi:hypothetical protein